jgi:hypothetical protein
MVSLGFLPHRNMPEAEGWWSCACRGAREVRGRQEGWLCQEEGDPVKGHREWEGTQRMGRVGPGRHLLAAHKVSVSHCVCLVRLVLVSYLFLLHVSQWCVVTARIRATCQVGNSCKGMFEGSTPSARYLAQSIFFWAPCFICRFVSIIVASGLC